MWKRVSKSSKWWRTPTTGCIKLCYAIFEDRPGLTAKGMRIFIYKERGMGKREGYGYRYSIFQPGMPSAKLIGGHDLLREAMKIAEAV